MSVCAELDQADATAEDVAANSLGMAVGWLCHRGMALRVSFLGFDQVRKLPWVEIRELDDLRRLFPGTLAIVKRDGSYEKWTVETDGIRFQCTHYAPLVRDGATRRETL